MVLKIIKLIIASLLLIASTISVVLAFGIVFKLIEYSPLIVAILLLGGISGFCLSIYEIAK